MVAYREKGSASTEVRRAVEELVEATTSHWRNGATLFTIGGVGLGIIGAALVVVGPTPTADNMGRGVPLLLLAALFAAIALFSRSLLRRYHPSHPVLHALLERPEDIVEIKEAVARSSSGAFSTKFLQIRVATREMLAFRTEETARYAKIFSAHCPKARVDVPGVG